MENNYVCSLSVRRNLAPATSWHWGVEMPDGHLWAASKESFGSARECLDDARGKGLDKLESGERAWAASHMDYALATRMNLAGDDEDDEGGRDDPLNGCLVLFACGVILVLALLAWGIMGACGRWPALCRILPPAGAFLLGIGTAAVWRARKR